MIQNGKPTDIGSGCGWGLLLLPVVFIGGGWLCGKLAEFGNWLFG